MNFANFASLKHKEDKKIFAFKNLMVQISNHKVKDFNFTSSRLHDFTISLPEHLRCSSVRSKTQSFHQFSVNFVIEILDLTPRNSHLVTRNSQLILHP